MYPQWFYHFSLSSHNSKLTQWCKSKVNPIKFCNCAGPKINTCMWFSEAYHFCLILPAPFLHPRASIRKKGECIAKGADWITNPLPDPLMGLPCMTVKRWDRLRTRCTMLNALCTKSLCLFFFWSCKNSPSSILALSGNKNWPPSMKAKSMENFFN